MDYVFGRRLTGTLLINTASARLRRLANDILRLHPTHSSPRCSTVLQKVRQVRIVFHPGDLANYAHSLSDCQEKGQFLQPSWVAALIRST